MTAAYAGQYNTYLPALEKQAGDALVVDFSRNPKKFPVNRYCQIVPTTKNVGRYIEMTVEMAGRLLNDNDQDSLFPDNADRPDGAQNAESFEFKGYITQRRSYSFRLGDLTAQQASWNILAQYGRIAAQRAMTGRTLRVVGKATNTANYSATHYSAVGSISGVTDKWDVSTSARADIQRSIHYGLDIIRRDTLAAIDLNEDPIILVMSPGCAQKIVRSQELRDYIKGSPDANDYIKGKLGPNAQYGLPQFLYGVEIVIEDTVRVTNRKGAAKATSYVLGDTTPFLCSRVGGLVGVTDEAPNFSTLVLFSKEEMTVETFRDDEHRRTRGHVTEDHAAVVVAPVSGFLFTAAVAA